MEAEIFISTLYGFSDMRRRISTSSVRGGSFSPPKYFFYIHNFRTKILGKIIRRAYGSRNFHFLLYMASET